MNFVFPDAIRMNAWPEVLDEAFACIAPISSGIGRFSRRNRVAVTYVKLASSLDESPSSRPILIHECSRHEKSCSYVTRIFLQNIMEEQIEDNEKENAHTCWYYAHILLFSNLKLELIFLLFKITINNIMYA